MTPSDLVSHIAAARSDHKSDEEIYVDLLSQDVKVEAIQAALQKVTLPSSPDTRGKTIQALVTVGAVLIGAGVFSFVAANWAAMGSVAKVLIIVTAMLVAYGLGWQMAISRHHKTSKALIFLGNLIFGSGIFLVGQIFHVSANWPDGFLLWLVGSLAMAYLTSAYSVLVLSIFAGVVALIGIPDFTFSPSRIDYLSISTLLLGLAALACYYVGHKYRSQIPRDIQSDW